MMIILLFYFQLGFKVVVPAYIIGAGFLGLLNWIVAAVGVGLCLSGPRATGSLGIWDLGRCRGPRPRHLPHGCGCPERRVCGRPGGQRHGELRGRRTVGAAADPDRRHHVLPDVPLLQPERGLHAQGEVPPVHDLRRYRDGPDHAHPDAPLLPGTGSTGRGVGPQVYASGWCCLRWSGDNGGDCDAVPRGGLCRSKPTPASICSPSS